jgi:two-component sensor histidine kinase
MAREIHHRVRNNLQVVSSLISLYSRNVFDPAAETAFKQIAARVDALTLIQRLIEREDTDSRIDMGVLFDQLAEQICALASEYRPLYRLNVAVQNHRLNYEIATPIILFAVEALLFELFDDAGWGEPRSVRLSLGVEDNRRLLLLIDDNTFVADSLRRGDPSADKIFRAFAEQLRGEYGAESLAGGGCRLSLWIPLPGNAGLRTSDEVQRDEREGASRMLDHLPAEQRVQ